MLKGGVGFPKILLGVTGADGTYTFTAKDLRETKYYFEEVKEGPFELGNHTLTQFKSGMRLVAEIIFSALTPQDTTLDTFLKTMEMYAGDIYLIPHLDYPNEANPKKYKMMKDKGWDYDYFRRKWLGFEGGIKLLGVDMLSEVWPES